MSDYDHSRYNRNFPHNNADTSERSTGLLWVLIVIAALGLLVFLSSTGGGPRIADHPGGAGADPVLVPVEPQTIPTDAGTIVE